MMQDLSIEKDRILFVVFPEKQEFVPHSRALYLQWAQSLSKYFEVHFLYFHPDTQLQDTYGTYSKVENDITFLEFSYRPTQFGWISRIKAQRAYLAALDILIASGSNFNSVFYINMPVHLVAKMRTKFSNQGISFFPFSWGSDFVFEPDLQITYPLTSEYFLPDSELIPAIAYIVLDSDYSAQYVDDAQKLWPQLNHEVF
jgi:hypothetical protein